MTTNDDKRLQSIDPMETYAYGTSKKLGRKKEKIKCKNVIKQYKKRLTLMLMMIVGARGQIGLTSFTFHTSFYCLMFTLTSESIVIEV